MESPTPDRPAPLPPPRAMRPAMTSSSPLKLALLLLAAATLILFHYTTPATAEHQPLHDLHRHLLYIPIILAGFWYGWRGGLVAAIVVSIFYFPHVVQHWRHYDLTSNVNRVVELTVYLVVGWGTGYLSGRLRGEEQNLRRANERLEEQSRQLEATLGTLREKTREVFETEEQLRRADRLAALGQLTSGMAHEIRNPLASIRGAAEILGDPNLAAAGREEFSRILVEETRRLDQVLGEFLDYARAQQASGSEEPSHLPRVVDKIRALLGRPMKDAAVTLESDLPADLPPLAIPENLLQQVLLNLMLNALQAMPGGGTLTLAAALEAPGRAVVIRLRDTGPGIAPADRERIFDPFYTTKPQGTGLGLSIVHKIIATCHGQIRVDPNVHAGAGFIIHLPRA